jgi:hypothetical protein
MRDQDTSKKAQQQIATLTKKVQLDRRSKLPLFILAFAAVGVIAILATKAAVPFTSLELEQGNRTNNVSVITDNTASGGLAVQFNTNTPPPPGGGCPPYPAFPDGNCTGWQHTGVTLTTYSVSCTLTSPIIIDSKIINCGRLQISSTGVVITRSKLNGTVFTDYQINYDPTFTDVEIYGGKSIGACVGPRGGTFTRVSISGCSQGMQNRKFKLIDSYIHDLHSGPEGPCVTGVDNAHGSGLASTYSSAATPNTIIHNRIIANNLTYDPWCSVPPARDHGGVSAAVTMYTHGNIWDNQSHTHFEKNFLANGDGSNDRRDFGGLCLYAGSTDGVDNHGMSDSKFFDNVFDRNPVSESAQHWMNVAFQVRLALFLRQISAGQITNMKLVNRFRLLELQLANSCIKAVHNCVNFLGVN